MEATTTLITIYSFHCSGNPKKCQMAGKTVNIIHRCSTDIHTDDL